MTKIDFLNIENLPRAAYILDQELGYMPQRLEVLQRVFNRDRFFGVFEEDSLVGVSTIQKLNYDEFRKDLPLGMENKVLDKLNNLENKEIGVIHQVAIDRIQQNKGYGQMLVSHVTENLQDMDEVIVFGWVSPEGCHISKCLLRNGYASQGIIENYWLEDTKEFNYECPICGYPCECAVEIFQLRERPFRPPLSSRGL